MSPHQESIFYVGFKGKKARLPLGQIAQAAIDSRATDFTHRSASWRELHIIEIVFQECRVRARRVLFRLTMGWVGNRRIGCLRDSVLRFDGCGNYFHLNLLLWK